MFAHWKSFFFSLIFKHWLFLVEEILNFFWCCNYERFSKGEREFLIVWSWVFCEDLWFNFTKAFKTNFPLNIRVPGSSDGSFNYTLVNSKFSSEAYLAISFKGCFNKNSIVEHKIESWIRKGNWVLEHDLFDYIFLLKWANKKC